MRRCPAAVAAVALLLAGCGLVGGSGAGRSGELVVFAASSLTEAFGRLGREYERRHPGTRVTFSFGSSARLATQLVEGAPADVFAAADPRTMSRVRRAGLTRRPAVFARNRLRIAVAAGNPKRVHGLADLTRPGVTVAVCARQVPCGAAAARALRAADVRLEPATYEKDVKATLSKLLLGEVDAALVYRTDVVSERDRVDGVDFPESARAVNDYPIAVLDAAPHRAAARRFAALVRSATGERVLRRAGFELP